MIDSQKFGMFCFRLIEILVHGKQMLKMCCGEAESSEILEPLKLRNRRSFSKLKFS